MQTLPQGPTPGNEVDWSRRPSRNPPRLGSELPRPGPQPSVEAAVNRDGRTRTLTRPVRTHVSTNDECGLLRREVTDTGDRYGPDRSRREIREGFELWKPPKTGVHRGPDGRTTYTRSQESGGSRTGSLSRFMGVRCGGTLPQSATMTRSVTTLGTKGLPFRLRTNPNIHHLCVPRVRSRTRQGSPEGRSRGRKTERDVDTCAGRTTHGSVGVSSLDSIVLRGGRG